jgi:uncharacterized protein (DUF2267 family)
MEYEEFIEVVGQASGGLSEEMAERATQATLQTLAERLPRGEDRHILQQLPAELHPWIHTETEPEKLDLDEFLGRVAQREGTDTETAFRHARAVFSALGRALSADVVAHLAAVLPHSFDPLLAEAQNRYVDIMPASEFWGRVAHRLGASEPAARRITDAVLETLAERIAAGQVEDLITRLDPLLHPPLRRGASSTAPGAHRMPLEQFLRRVAQREGADIDEAGLYTETFEHVRAVFATLAEAVGPDEWYDVTVELPADYHGLIPAGSP